MVKILKKINILMDKKQKRSMFKLFCLMVISAFLETVTVLMVMSVVQLSVEPETLEQGDTYKMICEALHISGTVQFSVLAILFLIFLYVGKSVFQFIFQRSLYRFVYSNQFKTAANLMKNFVKRDDISAGTLTTADFCDTINPL